MEAHTTQKETACVMCCLFESQNKQGFNICDDVLMHQRQTISSQRLSSISINKERLADDRFGESQALLRIFWPA